MIAPLQTVLFTTKDTTIFKIYFSKKRPDKFRSFTLISDQSAAKFSNSVARFAVSFMTQFTPLT